MSCCPGSTLNAVERTGVRQTLPGGLRRTRTDDVVPVGCDQAFINRAGDKWREVGARLKPAEEMQAPSGYVRDPGRELEAEKMAQGKHMVGDTTTVRVVALDVGVSAPFSPKVSVGVPKYFSWLTEASGAHLNYF